MSEAIEALPDKYPHPNQVEVYQRLKAEYELVLSLLQDYE